MEQFYASKTAQSAKAASEICLQISQCAERFAAIAAAVVAERAAGEVVLTQGYRLDLAHQALDASEAALAAAAEALQSRSGAAAALPHLDSAAAHLERGVASGSGAPALRELNTRRLAEIEAQGKAASGRIAEGRTAFDRVDDFAESSWSDIRGNGSEAQAAANRAGEHWELAQAANTMEAQDFVAAREHLDAAASELAFVDRLIEAVMTRLHDLEVARDAAKGLLEEAERSLNAALGFVRGHDADVGQVPEAQLREAAAELVVAQQEAAQPRPNWLRLASAATAADRLADTALVGARDEAANMAKLRQQVDKLRPLASAEVNKIARFVNVHGADIRAETTTAVRALVERFEQAQGLDRKAAELVEDQRRTALEQAMGAYSAVQKESEGVYEQAYADVQRLEQLRTELNRALSDARSTIQDGESLARQAGRHAPAGALRQLRAARASFDQIRLPINGEAELQRMTEVARDLTRTARDAAREIRRHLPRPPSGGGGPTVIVGGWGGSGSWGGGGGGGGGGSSWGGMGGGGGGFGGGGGGGSFGGGGGGGGW
jgi:hypothetical protein